MDRAGVIPSLSKEGWPRQGPGWFAPPRGEIPQRQPDGYKNSILGQGERQAANVSSTGCQPGSPGAAAHSAATPNPTTASNSSS